MLGKCNEAHQLESVAAAVPKCELHLHLDGSLSPSFITERMKARQLPLPEGVTPDGEGLRRYLHDMKAASVAKQNHRVSKAGNWDAFEFWVLQTKEELGDATFDILRRLKEENVWLCEIRFCPNLHTREELTTADAVRAVVEGFRRGSECFGIIGGVILCGLRSFPGSVTAETARLAVRMNRETKGMVLGFDIAGDEGSFPLGDHKLSLQLAAEGGIGVTCHAGEWPVNATFGNISIENLRVAVRSGHVARIGHGVQVVQDDDLAIEVLKNNKSLCFECCLTANVGWKIPSYCVHPIRDMVRRGIQVSLNSDNLLLSGSHDREASPTNEIIHFIRDVGMSYEDLAEVLFNGARSSFVFKMQGWESDMCSRWHRDFEERVRAVLAPEHDEK